MHSDGASAPPVTASSAVFSQGATVEYLRDLVQKRIITLTYMRNVHDGCVPLSLIIKALSKCPSVIKAKPLVPYYYDVSGRA